MRSLVSATLILIFSSFIPHHAQADFSLLRASANGYYATQQSGGNSYSLQANWTPFFNFSEKFYLRGNFGLVPLKSSASTTFIAYNGQILIGVAKLISQLGVEVGGGVETWIESGKIYTLVGVNLPWVFESNVLKVIDRVFLGYSSLMLSEVNATTEIKIGIGLSF